LHSFQSAKPKLSVYQTPIFGIEWAHKRNAKGKWESVQEWKWKAR
jgi:hypothetical protein